MSVPLVLCLCIAHLHYVDGFRISDLTGLLNLTFKAGPPVRPPPNPADYGFPVPMAALATVVGVGSPRPPATPPPPVLYGPRPPAEPPSAALLEPPAEIPRGVSWQ